MNAKLHVPPPVPRPLAFLRCKGAEELGFGTVEGCADAVLGRGEADSSEKSCLHFAGLCKCVGPERRSFPERPGGPEACSAYPIPVLQKAGIPKFSCWHAGLKAQRISVFSACFAPGPCLPACLHRTRLNLPKATECGLRRCQVESSSQVLYPRKQWLR